MRGAFRVGVLLVALAAGGTGGALIGLEGRTAPSGGQASRAESASIVASYAEVEPQEDHILPEDTRPTASRVLEVRIGPSPDYQVIGTVARGQRLDLVGRNETGEWLAIAYGGPSLRGWVQAQDVIGSLDALSLTVVRPVLLPVPQAPSPAAVPAPSRQPPAANVPVAPQRQQPMPTPAISEQEPGSPHTAPPPPRQPAAQPSAQPWQTSSYCTELAARSNFSAKDRDYYLRFCR